MNNEIYENPLITRYASREMAENFSARKRCLLFRDLWIALAESEMELGLPITKAQVDELKAKRDALDLARVAEIEKEVRHDVMAHVRHYSELCPSAGAVIHLGATSAYVGDNADIIIYRDALLLIRKKLYNAIDKLAAFAERTRGIPALGYTHFQSAQLTTVGKRACLWMKELVMDLDEFSFVLDGLLLRGAKGTTGSQASFLRLFGGDHQKVRELEARVCKKLGFAGAYPVSGQTYPRKVDTRILNFLANVAQSAYKFGGDLRLLQGLKELEEPFELSQIGSSAMAYKRNPMRAERMCSLARFAMALPANGFGTAAHQWFERTLDDSANRRLSLPQAFLAADGALKLYINIAERLVVNEKVIERRVAEELPFMATETILMDAVMRGGNRQELHEKLRQHSMAAGARVKNEGKDNDLLRRIAGDPAFNITLEQLAAITDPVLFVGRAPEQVREYLEEVVKPLLKEGKNLLGYESVIEV